MNDPVAGLDAIAMKIGLAVQAIAISHFVGNPRAYKLLSQLLIRHFRILMAGG
jgi:hypothetical protein